MWTTLALVGALSLAPAESGSLALTNVRSTYGILGTPRPDNKVLPGDQFVLSFDIEGIQTDDQGKAQYSVAMEVKDSKGKVKFKQEPRNQETTVSLGGNKLPWYASLNIGLEDPPGEYQVKVTVTDRAAKASKTLMGSYEVLPKAFGLVRLATTTDPDGRVPATVTGEGQTLWINFAAVGFSRDKAKGQPNLVLTMNVLDDQGNPTLARPLSGEVNENAPPKVQSVPMQFVLDLNRAGKFTIELKATDKLSGKKATLSLPLTVLKVK